jgi:hypothetical protein
MKSGLRPWVRLSWILSGLWLVGIGLYAFFSYRNPNGVPSPFVQATGSWVPWFDGGLFALTAIGGVAAIWLLVVGIPWVVQSFRDPGRG